MTISYSSGIPNPPNDPADDVQTMKTNAGAISDIIAIDHVGFNVSGGGQHNKVTFNANNVPGAFPVNPPVLFTDGPNNHGGTPTYPELFFYSGSIPQSSDQYILNGPAGSVMLMGGIILKWGTFIIPGGNNSATVSFANAYPNNNVFSVVITCTASATVGDLQVSWNTGTTASFNAFRQGSPGTPATYTFIAIGN